MANKKRRLLLFGSLYFSQGALMSYFLTFNILYLGEAGYGEADIGIFQAVLVLPFVLKIFLGMLSDGVNLFGFGHRKPYIIIGLLFQMLVMFFLPQVDVAANLGVFTGLALLGSIGMALYDTCTDGMALDSTPEDELGSVQGVMVGARAAGILVMLLAGGYIVERSGWEILFYLVALMPIIPLAILLPITEDTGKISQKKFQWGAFKQFGKGAVMLLAVMGLVYTIALDGVLTFLSDYLNDIDLVSIGMIGVLVAVSMVGRIVGALSNSWVTDRIGHKQSLFVAIVLGSAGCLGLAFEGGVTQIGFFVFLFGLAYGYYSAVYAAIAMDLSDRRIAASMFAIFMMFVNLGTVGGQSLGGILTEQAGFRSMVVVMAGVNLINIFFVIGIFNRKESVGQNITAR